ncbi:Oidioi.mRNA.OKI2018_I69.chr2.g6860.t1.cds [Oikopleura dioica]|uniref:Oidioi.mRNA.OKI2018_I69.chr2.g6860.t1.cds n=1 Tax=Oikopleura dioica TaxID=34765 RepID=A0ABN7TBD9_OIKDI|nr:Oidioi.mRNA.OKI2018_I69.chr2.g6860.t1.cds [Oikopleura dioica]
MSTRFRYTEIWRDMIQLLHEQVSVKNRRQLLKTYSDVFTGANAVDVLLENVKQRPDLFAHNTTREQVTRLCQRFIESRVFFPAKGDNKTSSPHFEDSPAVFYRFNKDHDYLGSQDRVPFSEVGNAHFGNRASSEPDLTRVNPPQSPKPHSNFSPRSSNFAFLQKKARTRLFGSGTTIENMHTDEEDSDELFELDYRIEREAVRVRLLQLLDLPFVEDFVCSPGGVPIQGNTSKDQAFSADMSAFHRQYKSCTDPWLRNGIDVLGHIQTGQAFLQKIDMYSPNRRKQLIYEHISDHYRKAGSPLISSQWDEVIQALQNLMTLDEEACKSAPGTPTRARTMKRSKSSVSKLSRVAPKTKKWALIAKSLKTFRSVAGSSFKDLVRFRTNGNRKESNEALQLFFRLLSPSSRQELEHLFRFLYSVSISDDHRVSDKHPSNVTAVQQHFASLIFPCHGSFMIRFCLERLEIAFGLPDSIKAQVQKKVEMVKSGFIDSPHAIPDALFANQIDQNEFQRQKFEGTNMEILKLIKSIENDPNFTNERRAQLLQSLQSQHPNAGQTLV